MAVSTLQTPGTYNLAYGVNAVTLQGLNPLLEDKYVLQILDKTGTTVLADIRQSANQTGYAEFDIQNVLQTFIAPSEGLIEKTDKWHDSDEEVFEYRLRYGAEANGIFTSSGTVTGLKVIGGAKKYWQVDWDETQYQAQVSGQAELTDCTVVDKMGDLLTDWAYWKPASQLDQQEPPEGIEPTDRVYFQKVRPSDNFTLSALQELTYGALLPLADPKGIAAYRIDEYDSTDARVSTTAIYNDTLNGGGPDTIPNEALNIADPYWAVTAGVGPAQLALNPNTKYYYVSFVVKTGLGCPSIDPGLMDRSAYHWWRFDIVEDKCNDYTPIQFSWLNTLGFRDYFFFEKRNERQIGISRNDYLAEANNWAQGNFNILKSSRGYTTYSQKLEETYVASSRFLEDYEASFLQYLFTSPDVRVRFGDDEDWYPVTLLTNSYTERTYRKDKLFQYDISFKMAHNIKSQRG
jgi:hypothetical protein